MNHLQNINASSSTFFFSIYMKQYYWQQKDSTLIKWKREIIILMETGRCCLSLCRVSISMGFNEEALISCIGWNWASYIFSDACHAIGLNGRRDYRWRVLCIFRWVLLSLMLLLYLCDNSNIFIDETVYFNVIRGRGVCWFVAHGKRVFDGKIHKKDSRVR